MKVGTGLLVAFVGVHAVPAGAQEDLALPGSDVELQVEFEPLFLLGTGARAGRDEFLRLDAAAFSPDGRLFLLDSEGSGLLVFDRGGRFIASVGRRGRGPGEFRSPRGIAVMEDGRVAVWDEGKRAFVMFGPRGEVLPEVRPGYERGVPDGPLEVTSNGALVAFPSRIVTSRTGHAFITSNGMSPAAAGLPLLRISLRDQTPVDVITRARVPEREPGVSIVAFEPWPSWGVLSGDASLFPITTTTASRFSLPMDRRPGSCPDP